MRRTTKAIAICTPALLACSCSAEQAPTDHGTVANGIPTVIESRPARDFRPTTTLEHSGGTKLGLMFEAWLSPHQEGGEERGIPAIMPDQFRSTSPSVDRANRAEFDPSGLFQPWAGRLTPPVQPAAQDKDSNVHG